MIIALCNFVPAYCPQCGAPLSRESDEQEWWSEYPWPPKACSCGFSYYIVGDEERLGEFIVDMERQLTQHFEAMD